MPDFCVLSKICLGPTASQGVTPDITANQFNPCKDICIHHSKSIERLVEEEALEHAVEAHTNLTMDWLATGFRYDKIVTVYGP